MNNNPASLLKKGEEGKKNPAQESLKKSNSKHTKNLYGENNPSESENGLQHSDENGDRAVTLQLVHQKTNIARRHLLHLITSATTSTLMFRKKKK